MRKTKVLQKTHGDHFVVPEHIFHHFYSLTGELHLFVVHPMQYKLVGARVVFAAPSHADCGWPDLVTNFILFCWLFHQVVVKEGVNTNTKSWFASLVFDSPGTVLGLKSEVPVATYGAWLTPLKVQRVSSKSSFEN